MKLRIEHVTRYRFSGPVFLEPHVIRLRPRNDPNQRLLQWALHVEPTPMRLAEALDAEGNAVAYAWFEGLTEELLILTSAEVESLRDNPFDFLFLDAEHARLPLTYPADSMIAPALLYVDGLADPEVETLLRSVSRQAGNSVIGFLSELNQAIYQSIAMEIRDDGVPYSPGETLRRGVGACRDVAVLYVECCRRVGLAARFVSGYEAGDPDTEERHLHAWAEVYLPGGGWRGFDPAHGLAVGDGHVVVAASAEAAGAAPVAGSFRATGVTAAMSSSLEMEIL